MYFDIMYNNAILHHSYIASFHTGGRRFCPLVKFCEASVRKRHCNNPSRLLPVDCNGSGFRITDMSDVRKSIDDRQRIRLLLSAVMTA